MRFWVYEDRIKKKRDVSCRKQNKQNQEVYQYWPLYWRIYVLNCGVGEDSWESQYSLEGLMLKLKLQYFGPLMLRTDSFEKDPDAGKDRRWEEKGTTEDERVGWHCHLNEHEFDRALGVGDGQRSLASMLQCQGPAPVDQGIRSRDSVGEDQETIA